MIIGKVIGYLAAGIDDFSSHSCAAACRFRCAGDTLMGIKADAFADALKNGKVSHLVVPMANSSAGVFGRAIELALSFFSGDTGHCSIIDELDMPICQSLIGFGALHKVKVVLSQGEAVRQCEHFLQKLNVRVEYTDVTSEAIRRVMEDKDPSLAAIGAKQEGLPVIEEEISKPGNTTRFVLVGRETPRPTADDKTILLVDAGGKPGRERIERRIHRVVNAAKITAERLLWPDPRVVTEFSHLGFATLGGHKEDSLLAAALRIVTEKFPGVKVLGSYPKRRVEVLK